MNLRTLLREIREFPGTVVLSAIWVGVFAAIIWERARHGPPMTLWGFLIQGIGNCDRFGDLSLIRLSQGQYWRLITCNFVHYSVAHLALNLLAFYILGTLIESWYGTSLLVFIYGVTGGIGNLLSALIRQSLGYSPLNASGGGSVVIMGLIGLCAAVGWRSRTTMGLDLGREMLKALGLTALLGIIFWRYIDNWGHACGAAVGFPLGFLHHWFSKQRSRPAAWTLGVFTGTILAGCAAAQVVSVRREVLQTSGQLDYLVREELNKDLRDLRVAALLGVDRLEAGQVNTLLEKAGDLSRDSRFRAPFLRARELVLECRLRVLTQEEQEEFDRCLGQLSTQVLTRLTPLLNGPGRTEAFGKALELARHAQTRPLKKEEKAAFAEQMAPLEAFVQRELETRIRSYWNQRRAAARPRVEPR